MKILQIYETGKVKPGGASVATVVFYLSKCLAELGQDVTVLERSEGVNPYFLQVGIKSIQIPLRDYASAPYIEVGKGFRGLIRLAFDRTLLALKFNSFIQRENFDVIHVHFPFASSILINLRKNLMEKMVYTAHVGEESKRFALNSSAPLALRLFSPDLYLMKRVAKSVVLNESLKKRLIAKGIPEEKLEVIPNGINVEDFNVPKEEVERVKAKYGLEGTVVMFAGTVTPRKGVECLIKAGEILKNEEVLFLIVGNLDLDREYAKRVMEYARRKGVNAKFTGFVPYEDLKALYSACDIFVLPSLEEGDPVASKEALASGKPLIGSNVGGVPMQIRDGWNGFLVEPANEKQLAEKIGYFVDNPEEMKRMGENSKKLAKEEFNWYKITKKYLKVYEEILNKS